MRVDLTLSCRILHAGRAENVRDWTLRCDFLGIMTRVYSTTWLAKGVNVERIIAYLRALSEM